MFQGAFNKPLSDIIGNSILLQINGPGGNTSIAGCCTIGKAPAPEMDGDDGEGGDGMEGGDGDGPENGDPRVDPGDDGMEGGDGMGGGEGGDGHQFDPHTQHHLDYNAAQHAAAHK